MKGPAIQETEGEQAGKDNENMEANRIKKPQNEVIEHENGSDPVDELEGTTDNSRLKNEEDAHRKAFLECLDHLRWVYRMRVVFAVVTFCGACLLALSALILARVDTCTEKWNMLSRCKNTSGNITRRLCNRMEVVPCECPKECSDQLTVKTRTLSKLRRISCNGTTKGGLNAYHVSSETILKVDKAEWIASPRC